MNKELLETISCLKKLDNWEEVEHVINVICNLVYEQTNERRTAAKYNRQFKIGKLRINVDFGE